MIRARIFLVVILIGFFSVSYSQIEVKYDKGSKKRDKSRTEVGEGEISFTWVSEYTDFEYYLLKDEDGDGVYEVFLKETLHEDSATSVDFKRLKAGKYLFYIQVKYSVPLKKSQYNFEIKG